MKRLVVLTEAQWKELASILWEVSCETEDGVKTLREDWSTAAIWRAVVDAPTVAELLESV